MACLAEEKRALLRSSVNILICRYQIITFFPPENTDLWQQNKPTARRDHRVGHTATPCKKYPKTSVKWTSVVGCINETLARTYWEHPVRLPQVLYRCYLSLSETVWTRVSPSRTTVHSKVSKKEAKLLLISAEINKKHGDLMINWIKDVWGREKKKSLSAVFSFTHFCLITRTLW